jgi:hypothetical protein
MTNFQPLAEPLASRLARGSRREIPDWLLRLALAVVLVYAGVLAAPMGRNRQQTATKGFIRSDFSGV